MSESPQPVRRSRTVLYTVIGFLAVVAVMYLWKEMSLGLLSRSADERREQLVTEQEQLEQQLRVAHDDRTRQLLELFAVPLGWAVRTEALQEDFSQIEEYAVRLVKEPMVQQVVLALPDGRIQVTTDKKLQDEQAERFFGDLANVERITLQEGDAGELRLAIPILGYSSKLGTLIITLLPEPLPPPLES